MKNVLKFPHSRHWPHSLTVHRDDHYHMNPDFFLNREVIITEKLDGGNTKIQNKKVYARSVQSPANQVWFDYVKAHTVPKLYDVDPNLCVLGEDLYAVHSIEYDTLPDSFFLFHILDGNQFWSWEDVKMFAETYELQIVPEIFRGKFSTIDEITELFMKLITVPSEYGPTREGFVMRTKEAFLYENFETNVCKFVRKNHVQTDQHWTKTWKPAKIN